MWDMVVIGGGASGLMAAVAACEQAVRAHRAVPRVLILEATDKVGRPILRSGNGRCNFSNAYVTPEAYNDAESTERVFAHLATAAAQVGLSEHAPNPVVAFFERLGLIWREESEGRLYPLANKASVVLDVLRAPLLRFGVEMRCDAPVAKVVPPKAEHSHFTMHLEGGELIRAHRVILAAGGSAGAFGLDSLIPFKEPVPVLGPLATEGRVTRPLDNIRVRCIAALMRNGEAVATERGEVQFRKYGVSGIAIFNLSRFAQPGDTLSLDLAPDQLDAGAFKQRRQQLAKTLDKMPSNYELLQGVTLPLVTDQILKGLHLEAALESTEASTAQIEERLHAFCLTVKGIGDADLCQVHRGGFAADAFSLETLEAKDAPGLHITGEALDVDGACGGYNLHWAFATGMLAGWHAEQARKR